MTLIVTEITSRWALQVSDRMLTTRLRSGDTELFDPRSNKAIIVHACNGIATVSYTGVAFIHGVPTDSWIAASLNGDEFPFDPMAQDFFSQTGMRRTTWPTIGAMVGTLANRLSDVAARPPPGFVQSPISLAVAGWLWYRKKRPRPFINLVTLAPNGRYGISKSPRRHGHFFFEMPLPASYLTTFERKQLDGRLSTLDLPEAADVLVSTIRMVAARTDTVGADCMVISIPHPWSSPCEVRTSFRCNSFAVPTQAITTPAYCAFTPWVIGPHQLFSPSAMLGCNITVPLGHYSLTFENELLAEATGQIDFSTIGPQLRRQLSRGAHEADQQGE